MHSARLFLKFKRSLLNQFSEQYIYLKYSVWHPAAVCNFTSSATAKTQKVLRCDCSYDNHILLKVPSRKFFSDIPQNNEVLRIPEKKNIKSPESVKPKDKSKNRKISIITKSGDPDTFGDMEDFHLVDALEDRLGDESDFHEDSDIFIPLDRKYKSPDEYLQGMKDLVKEKKLKQALELFLDMKRHLVRPAAAHYTFMIGACGRAGYTEMAFKLLRQMTDKGFKPTPATLTGLFNSCAESPNVEYGLKKAKFLKEKIPLKSWLVTVPTYHAMIKAFGRCGDIETAFEIVDEMIESGCTVTVETYNTLLISCISDKSAGFTHVIEVWRKMISKKLRPDIFSYNLLLRAVRDCGVGPEEVSCNLLQHWSGYHPRLFGEKKETLSREDALALPRQEIKLIGGSSFYDDANTSFKGKTASPKRENSIEYESVSTENNVIEAVTPTSANYSNYPSPMDLNLLSPRPVSGPKFLELEKVSKSADRLLLIGGVKGVLELMKKDKVTPDIKTFTMLLKIIPGSIENENELLSLIESYQVEPDVDFFNILIKNRNFRKDFKAAKEVLILITKKGLHPDIATFGVLALGCAKKKDGLQLLRDMRNLGFCPNVEIFGALLNSASRQKFIDLEYVCAILKAMKSEQILPSPKFLQMLENVRNTVREQILAVEQGKEVTGISISEKSYNEFYQLHEQWLKTTSVEEPVDPWLQYKTEITERVREKPYHM